MIVSRAVLAKIYVDYELCGNFGFSKFIIHALGALSFTQHDLTTRKMSSKFSDISAGILGEFEFARSSHPVDISQFAYNANGVANLCVVLTTGFTLLNANHWDYFFFQHQRIFYCQHQPPSILGIVANLKSLTSM